MSLPQAEGLYLALLGSPGRLRELRRLTYRCDTERCLLLDAIEVEPANVEAVLLHQKRFKNSDVINRRRSSEAGRAKNTFDGDTHWKPRTYFLGQSALAYPDDRPTPRLGLQCDHVGVLPNGDHTTISARDFHDDWHSGHVIVRVRSDGSRYAVR